MTHDLDGYREFASSRLQGLRRTAYLLCGDWHTADDLASTVLVKLLRHWRRVATMAHPDAYARRVLLRAWLDERRRPWRREVSWAQPPEQGYEGPEARLDRLAVLDYLAELPPGRRAVLVLRYYCDLSVEETAAALGVSTGTVKSQTARGLATVRARLLGPPVAPRPRSR